MEFVIDAYHRLFEIERSFPMSKHDPAERDEPERGARDPFDAPDGGHRHRSRSGRRAHVRDRPGWEVYLADLHGSNRWEILVSGWHNVLGEPDEDIAPHGLHDRLRPATQRRFLHPGSGLRLIKQTVNFDAPDTYHLYYGDHTGDAP
jgi:hypothetical protein